MPAVEPQAVLNALRVIQDPDLHRDIVSLGFVKDIKICGGSVAFTLELTTPACPVREQFKTQARDAVMRLPGVTTVNVEMKSQVRPSLGAKKEAMLPGVANIVPVASGKGGVGKSTVSANLALALARTGARVGLMDADVYGPSIPTIMGVREGPAMTSTRKMVPVTRYDVKIMSMGFFMKEGEAAIWRGPMLDKMIDQFLGGVEWGELDYLLVDLPPGTGDIQLSLCQKIPLTGAAIVSTPQDVAVKVAQKAITMFQRLNTPVLGMIENMSHYSCGHCGQREEIFGAGGARRAAELLKIPFLGEIPLMTRIRSTADEGRPIVLSDPDSEPARAFLAVAEALAAQISIRAMSGELQHEIKINF